MIDYFEISAFRGLKEISLPQMGSLNLIIGKNNSGKTSVLEAIAVGLSMGEPREILSIARKRDSRSNVVLAGSLYLSDIISWMFPVKGTNFWSKSFTGSIRLTFSTYGTRYECHMESRRSLVLREEHQGDFLNLEAIEAPRGLEVVTNVYEFSKINSMYHRIVQESFSLGQRELDRDAATRRAADLKIPFEYISPYSHRNSNNSEYYVRRLRGGEEKAALIDLLRSIDNNIVDISYEPFLGSRVARGGRAVVTTRDNNSIPLSVMGDGFRRVCELGFALHFARGGVLLIDEIEAGFHIGMLKRVYHWLTHQARYNRVQLVASSHSLEAIQAIVDVTPQEGIGDLRAYSIGLDRKFGKVRQYHGKDLYSLVSQSGLDIR